MLLKLSKRCALCGEGEDLSFCHRCLVGVHFECWVELAASKCPTLGCGPPKGSADDYIGSDASRHLADLMRDHEERTGNPPAGDVLDELVARAERMARKG